MKYKIDMDLFDSLPKESRDRVNNSLIKIDVFALVHSAKEHFKGKSITMKQAIDFVERYVNESEQANVGEFNGELHKIRRKYKPSSYEGMG